jgi:hypothetical protein
MANEAAYVRDAVAVCAANAGTQRSQWRWLITAMNLCPFIIVPWTAGVST